jgi:hypothetical protein
MNLNALPHPSRHLKGLETFPTEHRVRSSSDDVTTNARSKGPDVDTQPLFGIHALAPPGVMRPHELEPPLEVITVEYDAEVFARERKPRIIIVCVPATVQDRHDTATVRALGNRPREAPEARSWSAVLIARRRSPALSAGPFGSAQDLKLPSISTRKS